MSEYLYATFRDGMREEVTVETEFEETFDVIVAGLGTAGAEALCQAADMGLSVLGIERLDGLGGLDTLGCVWDYFYGAKGGKYEARDKEIREFTAKGYTECHSDPEEGRCIPGVTRAYILERDAVNAGARIAYHSVIMGVFLSAPGENGRRRIAGVRMLSDRKVTDVGARIVIDGTGDALVSRLCGEEVQYGREFDGMQAAFSKQVGFERNHQAIGIWSFGGILNDPDAEAFSQAIFKVSAIAPCLWNNREERALYEGQVLGVRESGHVVCRTMMTFRDVIQRKKQEKPIFYTFLPLDLSVVNRDLAFESDELQDAMNICNISRYGFSIPVDFGSLLPQKTDQLMVIGRHFGVEHDISGALRMKRDMKRTAEVAADAAYLAIRDQVTVDQICYDTLKEMLVASGCLNEAYDLGPCDLAGEQDEQGVRKEAVFPRSPRDIIQSLSKGIGNGSMPSPGAYQSAEVYSADLALWQCRMFSCEEDTAEKRAVVDALAEETAKKGEFWENYAVALALCGDRRAVPYLRMILENPKPDKENLYPNRFRAITLAGRMKDKEAMPLLLAILSDRGERYIADIPEEPGKSRQHIMFLCLSLTLAAIIRILEEYPDEDVEEVLSEFAANPFPCHAGCWNTDKFDKLAQLIYRHQGKMNKKDCMRKFYQ